MRELQLLVIFIVNAILLASYADATGVSNNNINCSASDLERGICQMNTFAVQYLCGLMKLGCGTIIGGPLSIFYMLSFVGLYAQNNTNSHDEVLNLTRQSNNTGIRNLLNIVNTYFEDIPEGVIDKFSDNVVSDYCNNFTQEFRDDAEATLLGNAFNINANNRIEARQTTNNMIANDTDNYVENAVLCTDIFKKNCTASKLILISGQYYLGRWRKEFVPAGKKKYTDMDNKTSLVDYVMQCDTYRYVNSDAINAQVIVINGAKNFFEVLFIIPQKGYQLYDVLQKLADLNTYQQVMNSLKKVQILLSLPKYSSATSVVDHADIAKKNGYVGSFFDVNTANFIDSNGVKRREFISPSSSKVIYETTLEGDESNRNNDCTRNKGTMKLVIDRPAAYFVVRKNVLTLCGIAKVDT